MLFFVHHAMDIDSRQEFWKDLKNGEVPLPRELTNVVGDIYIRPNAWEMYFYADAPDAETIWEQLKPYNRYIKHRKVEAVVQLDEYVKRSTAVVAIA